MILHPDDLLGRDLYCSVDSDGARPGVVRLSVTVVAFDHARGWKLAGAMLSDAWVSNGMFKRLLAAGVLTCLLLLATGASAQDLKLPTTIFAAAAAADGISTYRNLATGGREHNPMLAFTRSKPAPTVLVGAAADAGGVFLWNRYVGRRHPRIARAGLYAAAAFRIGLAVQNTQRLNRARRAR